MPPSRAPCRASSSEAPPLDHERSPSPRSGRDHRADPAGGTARQPRPAQDLLRLVRRRWQDLRDAARRPGHEGCRHRRDRRRHRDARPGRHLGAAGRTDGPAASGVRRRGHAEARGVRPRCRARKEAGADPGRRARALERRRLAASEALAGRRRAAVDGHRRLDDAQRAAPGKPQRRRRRHHRRARPGDVARHLLRPRRRGRPRRHPGRRVARPSQGGQGATARCRPSARRRTSSGRAT